MWKLPAQFGEERKAVDFYHNELISDRYQFVKGLQLIRDELQLAGTAKTDTAACGIDFSQPSVCTTLAKTNCGDRIGQGEATELYRKAVGGRFATISELGDLKIESFSPTGGGTDDGATLAHVTVAHQIDGRIRDLLFDGNTSSFVLAAIDIQTHVGRLEEGGTVSFGATRESAFREPRAACGAIVGLLTNYKDNAVHRRLKDDLGEKNFEYLVKNSLRIKDGGVDIKFVVAAAIVAIEGMKRTLEALSHEMGERGVGHTTASITVNRPGGEESILYLARGTAFKGQVLFQGIGTDASLYSGRLVEKDGEKRLHLIYDGIESDGYPIENLPGRSKL